MKILVFMWAYADGKVREVNLPGNLDIDDNEILDWVYKYGQNDFCSDEETRRTLPSVSIGDVALVNDEFWLCAPIGWERMTAKEYNTHITLPKEQRALSAYKFRAQQSTNR